MGQLQRPGVRAAAPPTGYALLLHLLTQQESGGLVVATHEELAAGLAMERGMISRAMQHLVAARLVVVVRRGRFQLHPMLAAFDSPRDQQRAIAALPRGQRLDVGDFEDEYERRLELHQQSKARKAEQRTNHSSKVAPLGQRRLSLGLSRGACPVLDQISGECC